MGTPPPPEPCNTATPSVPESFSGSGVAEGLSLHILTVYGSWRPQLFSSKANMDSVRKISLHSHLWIAALATALSIGTWSIAPAPANAGVVMGVGLPFPGLYVQYPYYPYPPAYYPPTPVKTI